MTEIPQNLKGDDLRNWLEANADQTRVEPYFRPFEPAEMDAERTSHADVSMEIESLQKQLKEESAALNLSIKERKTIAKDFLKNIRLRGKNEEGTVYVFKDYENRTITTVSKFGSIINSRGMTPEERQMQIPHLKLESNG